MNYIIENELVKVEISDKGAELQSIALKSDGFEYLWQGDPKYWKGRAYNLFPFCGRLFESKYKYNGQIYEIPSHGFVRSSLLEAEKISDSKIVFTLMPNDETRKMYPFDFEYSITYTLNGTSLSTEYSVKNNGEKDMYFAVGGHPGFNVPLNAGERFEDHYLEFDCVRPAKKRIYTPYYNTGRTEPYPLKDGKIFSLDHSLFDIDAVFLTDVCKAVTLKSNNGEKSVRVEYPDMSDLGIWHAPKTDAPYVCIEPWSSTPGMDGVIENIEEMAHMTRLAGGKAYRNEFRIIIK